MAKPQATRKSTTLKKSISSTAKRPQRTQKFLDDIGQALDDFDDEVFSFASEQREIAYCNFATYYRVALTTIWPKATDASIKTILKSVNDKQLQELKRMAHLLKPDQPKPTVVTEKRTVPALDNILGAMTSHLPQQNLPSTEVCGLISNIFSDLSTAHGFQAKATQGIAHHSRTNYLDTRCSCPTNNPVGIATWYRIAAVNTTTAPHYSCHRSWVSRRC